MFLNRRSVWQTAIAMTLAALLWFAPASFTRLDSAINDSYYSTALKKATLAYAMTRAVNATVSVLQHSEVQLEPGGVGVSIAAGQILDPLNDMAERLSDVLVMAIVAIGVQALAFDLGVELLPRLIAVILVLWALLALVARRFRAIPPPTWCLKLIVALLLVRLLMPATALINQQFLDAYVVPRVAAASERVELGLSALDIWSEADGLDVSDVDTGFWSKAKSVPAAMSVLAEKLKGSNGVVETTIGGLLEVCWLYVSLFAVQVIVLPLAGILLVMQVWRLVGSRTQALRQ